MRYLHIQIVMLLPTPNSVSLDRIMSAYTDDRIFSVELVGAVRRITVLSLDTDIIEQVLRQGSFINRMHKIGWTEPSYFNKASAKVSLQQCYESLNGNLRLVLLTRVSINFYHPKASTGNCVNAFLLTVRLCFVVFIN